MFNRAASQQSKALRLTTQTKIFPAPNKGWIKNGSLAASNTMGAEVLDNWFPTTQGIRMRKGTIKRATCDVTKAVEHIATYETGLVSKMFGCQDGGIYNVTPEDVADPDVAETALVTGISDGDFSSVQYQAGGGIYLVMVNGTDTGKIYNGTLWADFGSNATVKLNYDGQTANFTVGQVVTGGSSGAVGTIIKDVDDGTSGTLYLNTVTGTFTDNEAITDPLGGSALADGTQSTVYPAVSGVTTSNLLSVWSFKNQLFFIERGSLTAWSLDALSIGGTAHEIDLSGVFRYGGSLLFGGTFSKDAGSGLDDFCLFVTENGEIAVYQGSDPTDVNAWSLVGVYRVGKPLGKNAWFKAGGDLAIATDDGIVSVQGALAQDRAGQTPITFPIEEAWRDIINERAFAGFPFQTVLWQKKTMLVCTVPSFSGLSQFCLVANSRTGAWARYTGIDMRSIAVLDDKCYYGTPDGLVIELETGGADQDAAYACVCIPRFDTFGTANEKSAVHQRVVARTNFPFSVQLFAEADYVYEIPAPLPADPDEEGDLWGSGIWGTSVWGGLTDTKEAITEWQSVAAFGHALSPCIQVASGRATEPDLELIALHLQFQGAGVIV